MKRKETPQHVHLSVGNEVYVNIRLVGMRYDTTEATYGSPLFGASCRGSERRVFILGEDSKKTSMVPSPQETVDNLRNDNLAISCPDSRSSPSFGSAWDSRVGCHAKR